MPRKAKGWSSVFHYRTRVTHYLNDGASRAYCGAPIRLLDSGLPAVSPDARKAFRAKEICDHCQMWHRN